MTSNQTKDSAPNPHLRELSHILVLTLLAFAFFAVTRAYTDAYGNRRAELGKEWFNRGMSDLQGGRANAAIDDFRTALLYAPESWDYRLRLGEALTSGNRISAALDNDKNLWQAAPSDGSVNLLLARLAVRIDSRADVERYFNGAIFGIWKENAAVNRREALFELIEFYLQHNDYSSADSELLVLSDNLPDDVNLRTRVGALFLSVNDNDRARQQFMTALSRSPQDVLGLRGAAEAEFRIGDYDSARAFLERLLRREKTDPAAEQQLETVKNILSLDPSQPRIGFAERASRVLRDFDLADDRLTVCMEKLQAAQPQPLADLSMRSTRLKPLDLQKLRADGDLLEAATEVIYDVEKQTSSACGNPPPGPDMALLILARRQAGPSPNPSQ